MALCSGALPRQSRDTSLRERNFFRRRPDRLRAAGGQDGGEQLLGLVPRHGCGEGSVQILLKMVIKDRDRERETRLGERYTVRFDEYGILTMEFDRYLC